GVRNLEQFKERFQINADTAGGFDDRTGLHLFFEAIAGALPATGETTPVDRLREYEQHILNHTQAINTARRNHGEPAIEWKYHQYLALLLTELYLDAYFSDPAGLRDEINQTIAEHNGQLDLNHPDLVEPFATEPTADDDADPKRQLARLAFWCATGSGKTLLMHIHIHQFRHYHQEAYAAGRWPKLDQIILVTPNDGLSDQHARELDRAGLKAVSVGERGV